MWLIFFLTFKKFKYNIFTLKYIHHKCTACWIFTVSIHSSNHHSDLKTETQTSPGHWKSAWIITHLPKEKHCFPPCLRGSVLPISTLVFCSFAPHILFCLFCLAFVLSQFWKTLSHFLPRHCLCLMFLSSQLHKYYNFLPRPACLSLYFMLFICFSGLHSDSVFHFTDPSFSCVESTI